MEDSINTWSRNSAFAFILTHTNKNGKRGEERKGKKRREGKKRISLVLPGVGWKRKNKNKKTKIVLWKEIAGERSRREKGSLSLSQITIRFHRRRRGRKGIISRYKRKKGKEKEKKKKFHTYIQTNKPQVSCASLSFFLRHCCC